GNHFHDGAFEHRQMAFRLLGRSLIFGSPSARRVEVLHSAAALRRRLAEDFDLRSFRAAADLLPLWIPAATTVGCVGEVAEIVGPILRRRADAIETPPDVAKACEKAVQAIPATPAYPLLVAAAGKPKVEDRRPAVRI